ncbi:glutamate 5-kinase [Rhodospirillaceae bacterium KN72]|uniref:Glutamate 5-kinase n=1 Tax=Pacificispira spongiicola TaxID=2729598 RepID=A0A7Y0E1W5_9PROT|nr:glutamate 5-kinase [Pacificispira spongiicola]NMM45722.1 glutamate 5-kinase [Pacificispira spongiicola]
MTVRVSKRLVIKIGSALLVEKNGEIRRAWLEALADDIAVCKARGQEVLIVSSGSIAVGRRQLGLGDGTLKLEEKQAAAAIGQIELAHAYKEALGRHGIKVAQLLLTPSDTEERRRHLNARATVMQLLKLGVVPVINENDTVATSEIRYGDNDRLAARVATMASADLLVLLSDIDGLYTADPRKHPDARHIPEIAAITPDVEAMAGDAVPGVSTGGMITKLDAAKIAVAGGCRMAIALGKENHALKALADGARASWFLPSDQPLTARKRWISGTLKPVGEVVVDAGALAALGRGKSLLPAGVKAVHGRFDRGDAVLIKGPDGRVVGKGLSAYSSEDAERIAGRRTADIQKILGFDGRAELIHRDDMSIETVADTAETALGSTV